MPKLPLIIAALVTSGLTFTTVNAGGFFSSRQDSRGFELESFVAHKSTHQRTYQRQMNGTLGSCSGSFLIISNRHGATPQI